MSQQAGSGQPGGWYNDPYGRFQLRFWSGTAWTEHVSTNGVQQVDPLGTSTVVPFAIPQTASSTPAASAPAASDPGASPGAPATFAGFAAPSTTATPPKPFMERLGADARERPVPQFSTAVAGLGGTVIAAGALAAVADSGRGTLIAVSLMLIVGATVLRLVVAAQVEARAAAVGAVVLAIPAFAGAATSNGDDAGSATALVAAALYLTAWALPGFRGRTVLLGLGALTAVGALASLASGGESDFGSSNGLDFVPSGLSDTLGTGFVYLVGGVVLLVAVWRLDKAGYRGAATGLAAAGLVASFVGTVLVASDVADAGGALLVLVAGAAICLVGAHGGRRATTWTGATLAAFGAVGLIAVTTEPSSVPGFAGALLFAGVLLIGAAVVVRSIRAGQAASASADVSGGSGAPR